MFSFGISVFPLNDDDSGIIDWSEIENIPSWIANFAAENGITETDGVIKLGGALTQNTQIDGEGFGFDFVDTGNFNIVTRDTGRITLKVGLTGSGTDLQILTNQFRFDFGGSLLYRFLNTNGQFERQINQLLQRGGNSLDPDYYLDADFALNQLVPRGYVEKKIDVGVNGLRLEIQTDNVNNLTDWAGRFDKNYIVATEAAPTTGNLIYDFTGAVLGTKVIIFHNSSTIPTFSTTTRFIDGVYIPNVVNRIELVLDVESTIVNCTISQPASIIIPDLKQGFSVIAQTINVSGTATGTGTTNIASSASLGAIDEMVVDASEARGRTPYSNNMFLPGSCNWVYDIKFKTPSVLSNSTDRYVIFLGTGTTTTNPHSSSNRCGVVYSDNINSGKFNLEVGAATSLDLGVTVAADTEYHIVMEHRNGTIKVWINGSLSGTLVATPSNSASRPLYNIANTAGAATFTMQVGPLNFGIYDY